MNVKQFMRRLIELPHDMEVVVVANEIEEIFLRVDEVEVDKYSNTFTLILYPKEKGYTA